MRGNVTKETRAGDKANPLHLKTACKSEPLEDSARASKIFLSFYIFGGECCSSCGDVLLPGSPTLRGLPAR
ncbi:hypothetical protein NDU88_005053 [Pleurodeles waltl]|uniref:Uncharacterized protein n=1 Tax=Pleurodeles waltl TaxID=8319 RepID=A0AAV7TUC4_PLEWA|nr:hypothetical protein NDU88_005053 [Pleurodeles waltl]